MCLLNEILYLNYNSLIYNYKYIITYQYPIDKTF